MPPTGSVRRPGPAARGDPEPPATASPAGSGAPLRGVELGAVDVVEDAYVLCENGKVSAVGAMRDFRALDRDVDAIDGRGLSAVPGLTPTTASRLMSKKYRYVRHAARRSGVRRLWVQSNSTDAAGVAVVVTPIMVTRRGGRDRPWWLADTWWG